MDRERGGECERTDGRVVGVSVSEWETESEQESSSREGGCERRLLYRYNKQLCFWPKPEWFQAVPVIHVCLLRSCALSIQNLRGETWKGTFFLSSWDFSAHFIRNITPVLSWIHISELGKALLHASGSHKVSNKQHSDLCK